MTLTITITPKELERQAVAAFQGKPFKVFLAYNAAALLGISATTAAWQALELPATGGYAPVTGSIGTGAYNTSLARYELPVITAQFTGAGTGFVYDTLVVVIDNSSYPHSVTTVSPEQGLLAGQSRSYLIRLLQDD